MSDDRKKGLYPKKRKEFEMKPLRVGIHRRVVICPETMAIDVAGETCGCSDICVDRDPATLEGLSLWVGRAGQCQYEFAYDAFDFSDTGAIRFVLDSRLVQAKTGYYYGLFVRDGEECGQVVLHVKKSPGLQDDRIQAISCNKPYEPCLMETNDVSDIFAAIDSWTSKTAEVLAKDTTQINLCSSADLTALTQEPLCRAVELVIEDGMNTEIVTYDGSSPLTVTRGNPCYKFPAGATIKFAWTTNNVLAAVEGCA